MHLFDDLQADARYAVRSFWSSPGVMLAAVTSSCSKSHSPLALGGAAAFVLATAFAATVLPTRRALRVDPTVTLRYE